jgi:hypothetical protein
MAEVKKNDKMNFDNFAFHLSMRRFFFFPNDFFSQKLALRSFKIKVRLMDIYHQFFEILITIKSYLSRIQSCKEKSPSDTGPSEDYLKDLDKLPNTLASPMKRSNTVVRLMEKTGKNGSTKPSLNFKRKTLPLLSLTSLMETRSFLKVTLAVFTSATRPTEKTFWAGTPMNKSLCTQLWVS